MWQFTIYMRDENDRPIDRIEVYQDGSHIYYRWMIPATHPRGARRWCEHNEYGSTRIFPRNIQFWKSGDQYHRNGGPAIIYKNGEKYYFIHGHQITKIEHDFFYND